MEIKNRKIDILSPFGPRIAKAQFTESIINKINNFVDEVVSSQTLSKKYDLGKNLAGQVSQEITLPEEIFKGEISDFLFDATKVYVKAVTDREITKFSILNTWVVRQFKSEYNPTHWHSAHISGVGYIKMPDSFGKSFQEQKTSNPHGYINFVHGTRQFLSGAIYSKKPKVGDVYFFPNYMMHSVYPFYSDGERRSWSFNILIDDDIYNVYSAKLD